MADPLTVIGAVASTVQIIDVLTKAVSALDKLRAQWQSSDIALLSLTSQLGALSAALSKIQEWMQSGIEEIHHQLVMDLSTSITCCKMLATKLYAEINDLQRAPGGSLLTTAKARFVFKRSGIGELQNMVDRQTAALTLLLTACNSKSIAKQQEMLGTSGARKRMDRVHEDTESLRGTLDSSSYLSRSTERSSRLSMLFDFDDELFSSRSYKAMIRKTVKLSIRSPRKGAPGPEEVVTTISSNAVGSPSMMPLPKPHVREQAIRRQPGSSKLVLLGQGESAKTTFIKQMQWTYGSGFSNEERLMWRNIIYENLNTTFRSLFQYHSDLGYVDLRGFSSQAVSKQPGQFHLSFPSTLRQMLTAYGQNLELSEDSKHFTEHLDRICDPTYIPTIQDIFHARARTTGIHVQEFSVPDYGLCSVYDVGGERSERKKWRSIFDQNATVLFFVPMDSYDEGLYEDQNSNRMQEALFLFESVVNTEDWWSNSEMFLCFTKYDLFKKKIETGTKPLKILFPEYEGPLTDIDACREYITGRFTSLMRQRNEVGIFYMDATDTQQAKEVVETVLAGGNPSSVRFFAFERRSDSLDVSEEI